MANIFKIASIIGVLVSALIIILLVLDIATYQETKDLLIKVLLVIAILTAASIVISFISSTKNKPKS